MTIAIVGASGDIGRRLVLLLARSRLLSEDHRVVLVGRSSGASKDLLYGLLEDLKDAFGGLLPQVEVCLDPEEIDAQLVVMTAGVTFPRSPTTDFTREKLRAYNLEVFRYYADLVSPRSIVIHVSNPVELGVKVFADRLGLDKVVGMGCLLDTLRFRKEIARAWGVPVCDVSAMVLGDHGPLMVPLWSSVRVSGWEGEATEARIREELAIEAHSPLMEVWSRLISDMKERPLVEIFRELDRMPMLYRLFIRPWLTHYSGSKTVVGPAGAVMMILEDLLTKGWFHGPLHVVLRGEFYGFRGIMAVPVVMDLKGVVRVVEVPLWDFELEQLRRANEGIMRRL